MAIQSVAEQDAASSDPSFEDVIAGTQNLDVGSVDDLRDPMIVAEYADEILEYMKKLERETVPDPNYVDNQWDIDWDARYDVVDWVMKLHKWFRLPPESLFLAVNIIDRFLSRRLVRAKDLSLVGATAIFIASKYEDLYSDCILLQRLLHATNQKFTKSQICVAEKYILAQINYDLSFPNPVNFVRHISKVDDYDPRTRTLAKYLLEVSCLDHRYMKHVPSLVAAAAMYVARVLVDGKEWDAAAKKFSGYEEQEILPITHLMIENLCGVPNKTCFEKYNDGKFRGKIRMIHQFTSLICPSIRRTPSMGPRAQFTESSRCARYCMTF